MAADPGSTGAPYHLFLTRIPPKLPKEEVEAALTSELAARRVEVLSITVVPQSAWKNKGFGFVVLAGSPSGSEIAAIAVQLDNNIRVGGKALNVRVCQAPVSGSKPAVSNGPLNSWDQPPEKIARLCAQVLHCYFARRAHQEAYKAEKLLALLSATVAPSCSQEPRPLSLWGRDIYGGLEAMLLAFGDVHFGGGWSLTGTIAERSAILSVGKARHMQGWDALRDPLPIATLLRLAACKQRLEDIHTPEASSGFSTPTVCRRCSDCGSLSAMHSTEQPSCSQSEASWSLRSLCVAAAASATETPASSSSEATSSLGTPSNGAEGQPALSSSTSAASATPVSWGSCKSLERCPEAPVAVDTGQPGRPEPRPPDLGSSGGGGSGGASRGPAAAAGGTARPPAEAGPCPPRDRQQTVRAEASSSSFSSGSGTGRSGGRATGASTPGSATGRSQRSKAGGAGGQQQQQSQPPLTRPPSRSSVSHSPAPELQQQQQPAGASVSQPHPVQHHHHHHLHHSLSQTRMHNSQKPQPAALIPCGSHPPAQPPPAAPSASSASPSSSRPTAQPHKGICALMPTAQDLMGRCAHHLKLLFARSPGQDMFMVPDLAKLLSEAPDVVAWGNGSPYFSLEGYAHAVYGSFERFLLEISRLYFGGRWYIEGGYRAGELRVLCFATCGARTACSTPGQQGSGATRGSAGVTAAAAAAGSRDAGKSWRGKAAGEGVVKPKAPRVPAGAVITG